MLRIRKPQQTALGDKDFIERLEGLLAEDFYGRRVTPEERARLPFREMIEHGITVARGYGMKTERDLAAFVLHMVRINPEFHLQPKIRAILDDTSLEPSQRREKLLTGVSTADWDAAARMTDADDYWDRALPPPVPRP